MIDAPSTTDPSDESQADDAGPRIRTVMFDADLEGDEIDPASLDGNGSLGDQQLLWIDVQMPEAIPEGVPLYGANPEWLQPEVTDKMGAFVPEGEWRYLYVRALNWASGRKATDEALVVAIGPNVVITTHRAPIDFLTAVLDSEAGKLRVGQLEAATFAATLLDRMLTDYLDARDEFETALDRLELLILRRPRSKCLGQLQHLRRVASRLRRYLAVQRDLFDAVGRPDFDPDQSELVAKHYRLLSARYSKVMLATETARELVNGSFDLYSSRVAEATNDTMHRLTFITVALGTLSVVAGVLGMNFDAPLFNTGARGFWITVAAMSVFTVVVVWMTWRRRRGGV